MLYSEQYARSFAVCRPYLTRTDSILLSIMAKQQVSSYIISTAMLFQGMLEMQLSSMRKELLYQRKNSRILRKKYQIK